MSVNQIVTMMAFSTTWMSVQQLQTLIKEIPILMVSATSATTVRDTIPTKEMKIMTKNETPVANGSYTKNLMMMTLTV
jgi:hypothetical protein